MHAVRAAGSRRPVILAALLTRAPENAHRAQQALIKADFALRRATHAHLGITAQRERSYSSLAARETTRAKVGPLTALAVWRESSSRRAVRRRARRAQWAPSARLGRLRPRRARRAATATRRAARRPPSAAHARQDLLAQLAQRSPSSAPQAALARAATQRARPVRPACSRTAAARLRARPAWRVTTASKALQRRCRAPPARTQAARRWPAAASAPSASLALHAAQEWSCQLLATLAATPHRLSQHTAPSAQLAHTRTS